MREHALHSKKEQRAKGWDSSNLEPNSEHVVQLMIINAFYFKVLILLLAALAVTASTVSTVGAHDTDASKLMSYKTGEAPRHVLSKRSPIPLGPIALPLRIPIIKLGKLLAKPGLKLAKLGAVIG